MVRARGRRHLRAVLSLGAAFGLLAVDVIPANAADTTAPAVVIAASATTANQGVPITITATATDPSRVNGADYQVDGGAWRPMSPSRGIGAGTVRTSRALVNAAVAHVRPGAFTTCTVMVDGTAWCWGSGQSGALGNGTTTGSSFPVQVTGITTAVTISSGGGFSCVVLGDGSVKCWGDNSYGQIGDGTSGNLNYRSTPVAVSLPAKAVAISAGWDDTCAVLADGTVQCWGRNDVGQVGSAGADQLTPKAVPGIVTATGVDVGTGHACAVLANHTITCWGENADGELGNGTTTGSGPVQVSGITTAASVAAGDTTTCARLSNSSVKCWGHGSQGELGTGGSGSSATPVAASAVGSVVSLTGGDNVYCGRRSDGTVLCWGNLVYTPYVVAGLSSVTSVWAFRSTICARLSDQTVRCWGENDGAQLGYDAFTGSLDPVAVPGLAGASSLTAGSNHSCVVLADHTIRCWGANDSGQLGDGTRTGSATPVAVAGITNAAAVDAGQLHTCALLTTGTVKCWGSDHAYLDSLTPVAIAGVSNAVQISAGGNTSCAVIVDGTVRCWGRNDDGQVGNGNKTDQAAGQLVSGISNAASVAAGWFSSCALLKTSNVVCWGDNTDGTLGDGTKTSSLTPVGVSGLTTAVAVATSWDYACAVLIAGSVACWGTESDGQLGNGGTNHDSSPVPVVVAGLSSVASIDAALDHVCIVRTTGSAACWGSGGSGELGDRTRNTALSPVDVLGVSAAQIAAGDGHSCAQLSGAVTCWGADWAGQLGVAPPSFPTANPVDGLTGQLSAGSHTVCVRASDVYGNTSPGTTCVTLTINDNIAPVMGTPVTSLRTGLALSSGSVRMAVTWAGNDNTGGSGIAFYTLASSLSGGTTWATVNSSLTTPSDNVRTLPTGTLQFRVMAVDKAGNAGPWTVGPNLMARLVQNTSSTITPVGTWATESSASDSGGSSLYSSQAAASVSTTFTGTSIALITTLGPDRGAFKVYVDGTLDKTVDAYSATATHQMQAWAKTFASSGTHTIKVVVVGTAGRPRVDVDAFATLAPASSSSPGPTPPTTGGGIPTPPNTGTLGTGTGGPGNALLWASLMVLAGVQLAAVAAWSSRRGSDRRRGR